jgi:hypothetical protein
MKEIFSNPFYLLTVPSVNRGLFLYLRLILNPHLAMDIIRFFLKESMVITVFHFLELFGKYSPICYNTMVNQLVDGGLHE